MKRFDFRLARVLKLKRQQAWLAEQRQKQARAVLDTAQARVTDLEGQLAQTAASLVGHLGHTVDSSAWIARYEHSMQIEWALDVAEARVQEAFAKWQETVAKQTQMRQEVEALLHLRRQQWQAYQREVSLEQQEHLDELSMRRWMIRQAEGPEKK